MSFINSDTRPAIDTEPCAERTRVIVVELIRTPFLGPPKGSVQIVFRCNVYPKM